MSISIIIPTLNEQENVEFLIPYLKNIIVSKDAEIIISDGGSKDNTTEIASKFGVKVIHCAIKGRAFQMNEGAKHAIKNILYFVHADTIPPTSFYDDIIKAMFSGFAMGRYLSTYQSKSVLLKINAALSRFDTFGGMGGDQTLFINHKDFTLLGGFDSSMQIMEEFEFCTRARKKLSYKIIKKPVSISARKYKYNSWLKVQWANYNIVKMYLNGASQQDMVNKYKYLLG